MSSLPLIFTRADLSTEQEMPLRVNSHDQSPLLFSLHQIKWWLAQPFDWQLKSYQNKCTEGLARKVLPPPPTISALFGLKLDDSIARQEALFPNISLTG